MKLQDKILYCRRKAMLSQEALAERIGVSRQAISKWETGEAQPEISKLLLLAKIFGVTTDWLLSEDEPEDGRPEPADEPPVNNPPPCMQEEARSWVDAIPGVLGRLIKRYGWLFGVRMAVGGALFTGMGVLIKAMFSSFMTSSVSFSSAVTNVFDEFGNAVTDPEILRMVNGALGNDFGAGMGGFSSYSSFASIPQMMGNFVIVIGVVMLVGGIALAVALKRQSRGEH